MGRNRLRTRALGIRGPSIGAVLGLFVSVAALSVATVAAPAVANHLTGSPATYTLDADFDEGTAINVGHAIADQLQLDDTVTPFPFIWIAASQRGTIIKIDTATGAIKGEYRTAPEGRPRNPSRTTVDNDGNVWVGNRDEALGGQGSVAHVGLLENNECQDRDGNGTIETSAALGDIRPWTNAGGIDNDGGVETAADECIIHYTRTSGTNVRTVAVDSGNDVWVGGYGNRVHEQIDGETGVIVPGTTINPGLGGYGGLIDANGILWSATLQPAQLLRIDTTVNPPTFSSVALGRNYSYGLGTDGQGNIWHSNFCDNTVQKISPSGVVLGTFPTGGAGCGRGVTVTPDDHVWVANSGGANVSRLDNNGNLLAVIPVGSAPTGLAVDADGKVWATNLGSNSASRIDPSANAVDLTVNLGAGAGPYNYSDMTGSTLIGPPDSGTWTIVHDSGIPGAEWGSVSWTDSLPGDSSLTVTVASSEDGVTFGPPIVATDGADLSIANGRYLRVVVDFERATTGESPILYDLTIAAITNEPPDCSTVTASPTSLWPPDHTLRPVTLSGATDPDGDPLTLTITGVTQDEPLNGLGDGDTSPDAQLGATSDTVLLRAERSGKGDGRVYRISFSVSDGQGGSCEGVVTTSVLHSQRPGATAVDSGLVVNSFGP
jgi:streptogramin lyase